MLHIHALIFFTVLELLLVFALLWIMWFYKARRLTRQLETAETRLTEPRTEANAAAYFAAELQATEARLDHQRDMDSHADTTALALRAAYLSLERELAQGQQRDEDFWQRAQHGSAALLAARTSPPPAEPEPEEPAPAAANPADAVEAARVKQLFDAQIATISELKEALASMMAEHPEWQTLLGQLDTISRTNREMSLCVSILEDDNAFLRGQLDAIQHPE